ncbi:hypothetical protein TNCV_166841, partial [Trichonephila clavipes]
MDVCKCIAPSRQGGTLNSRRAASPSIEVGVGEREVGGSRPLPQNVSRTEQNHTVTYMVLKAKAKDRDPVTDSWPQCHELELSTAEDLPCRGGRCSLNLSKLKLGAPPIGVLWKLGEGVSPSLLES